MSQEGEPPAEILALQGVGSTLAALLAALQRHGVNVDRADSLADLQGCFLRAGGHQALILAPDVPQIMASRAVASLASIDPRLLIVSFAHPLPEVPRPRVLHLGSLHPAAPVACGAIVRALALRTGS